MIKNLAKLNGENLTNLSRQSGIPYQTLNAIKKNRTGNPYNMRIWTLVVLSHFDYPMCDWFVDESGAEAVEWTEFKKSKVGA